MAKVWNTLLGISNNVLSSKNQISLIHGPPGTGKTNTIIGLIIKLLNKLSESDITPKGQKRLKMVATGSLSKNK